MSSTMSYATVSMGLRPSRVVVVFDGGDHWTYWARRALQLCGRVWGGCGFAVVPHRDGEVNHVLLRACRAYDPDFVVTFPRMVGEMAKLHPGWIQFRGDDGQLLSGRDYDERLEQIDDQEELDEKDEEARNLIAAVCSPYRMRASAESRAEEDVTILSGTDERTFPAAVEVPGAEYGPVLACRPEWGGLMGVAVASHAGIVERPRLETSEPDLSTDDARRLSWWLAGARGVAPPFKTIWFPTAATSVEPGKTPTADQRSMAGLVTVSSGHDFRRTGLVAVGDAPEDFALARLWRLTFGTGMWLPSVLESGEGGPSSGVLAGLAEMARGLIRKRGVVAFTSLSQPEKSAELRDRLISRLASWPNGAVSRDRSEHVRAVPSADLPWRQPLKTHLALSEEFATYVPVPAVQDAKGTRRMAAPLPPPVLTQADFAGPQDLSWHVDVSWQQAKTVEGRGLDGSELFTPDTERMLTWVRSSRGGISYQSHRYNFVLAGIPAVNKLARPALMDLSLPDWIAAKSREHKVETRLSDPGQRAALLTRMLGGRSAFVDLFGGPLLPALRSLRPTSRETSKAYPDHDGVVLSAEEGVLAFEGFRARCSNLDVKEVRDRLDAALHAGVLRRGMVLRCPTCEQKQFQPIDKLGHQWTCARCDEVAPLDRAAWKMPDNEPIWFYDLHPVGRQLLRDNGEVPAMLSLHLAAEHGGQSTYQDVEETTFVEAGQPQVEADLIAYVNDTLIVAECKSAEQLDTQRKRAQAEVAKKCQVARWLGADQLIFATTARAWTAHTVNWISGAVKAFRWPTLGRPEVYLIANLGGKDVLKANVDI
jgi:hypothetical protein